jgi:2-haloacid dehalogenase
MFKNAGLENFIERYIGIDEIRHWKPTREVYLYAAKTIGLEPSELALIAAHDWDINGANQVGLITGFVERKAKFSAAMQKPDVSGSSVPEVAKNLLSLPKL